MGRDRIQSTEGGHLTWIMVQISLFTNAVKMKDRTWWRKLSSLSI